MDWVALGDVRWAWAAVLCAAGAGGCAGFFLVDAVARARDAREAMRERVLMPQMTSTALRLLLPVARLAGLSFRYWFARRKDSVYHHFLDSINRLLSSAGRPQGINADEFVGYGLVWTLVGAGLGVVIYAGTLPQAVLPAPVWAAIMGCAAIFMWWRWLQTRRQVYQTSVRRDMPFCLDLLTLAMEAGLDFTAALSRLAKKIGATPLGREFSLLYREIQFGKGRTQALRDFARRVDVAEVRSLVASLVQAEELGAPLGPILRILAAQQREQRSQRAEEQAMKAPVKILFPLVFCIFPGVMLILLGPIGMALMASGW